MSSADSRGPIRAARSTSRHTPGENRDVAAGDGDDVIRPGFLERPLDFVIESGAIADQNRRHDRSGARAPGRDARLNRPAHGRANGRERFGQRAAVFDNLDEPIAFHRSDERRPTPREQALGICDAGIEIPGGPPQGGRKCHAPACPPSRNLIAPQFPADADERSSRGCESDPVHFDGIDLDAQCDA